MDVGKIKMTFEYRKSKTGVSHSNIIFPRSWPSKKFGKFPAGHPCADEPLATTSKSANEIPESDSTLGRFRKKGYWALCFPEGDGISFDALNGQSEKTIVADIMECFDVYVTFRECEYEKSDNR